MTKSGVNITVGTLSNNSSSQGSGGGIYNSGNNGPVRIGNSIIAQNTAPSGFDLSGSFITQGHNLVGRNDGSSGFTLGTNVNGDLVGGEK